MKRMITLAVAIAATLQLSAQESGQVQAKFGTAYLENTQGSYMPDFRIDGKEIRVNNVILMIGDGMGLGTISAAMFLNGGELTITNLHSLGYVRTQAADNFTTDSAASGTAYACGQKAKHGTIGVDTTGLAMLNLPEKLTPLGYACGVISNDDIVGATPSAFFAHRTARSNKEGIWEDLPKSPLKFISAGSKYLYESQSIEVKDNVRKTFQILFDPAEILTAQRPVAFFPENMEDEGRTFLPTITETAIEFLSKKSKKGFFLMVEGSHIDHKAHSNKADELMTEMLEFDRAVAAAIRFAEKDRHTLVIVSADHETGSVGLLKSHPEDGEMRILFGTKSHSGIMVPLFAYGPKSRRFCCIQENSDVSNKIMEILSGR